MATVTAPRLGSVMQAIYEAIRDDADILALTGAKGSTSPADGYSRIWNNVPQDTARPYIRYHMAQAPKDDTKTDDGYAITVTFDIWTDGHTDLLVLQLQDQLRAALHNIDSLAITGGTVCLIQYLDGTTVQESDEAHHGVTRFRVLVTS